VASNPAPVKTADFGPRYGLEAPRGAPASGKHPTLAIAAHTSIELKPLMPVDNHRDYVV